MSAPVPLSLGCCSPPCPSNPQTAVPGPSGENAFSNTTANFTQPVVGGNVVISLTHDGWVAPNQILFLQGGGFYQVVSVSGLTVTVTNLGGAANSIPGTVINSGAQVSPGGEPGTGGNAFTTTNANYTQPNVAAQVNVAVISSAWAAVGQRVFVATGGYYTVFSVPDATHMNLTNDGDPVNAAPATLIISPQQVSPAGLRGATGATGVSTLNSVSPTTTKGDLIVDNGANSPLANDVRFAVGTNGQILASDSTQATGLHWQSTIPTTVATSGDIAVFNATTGTPVPLADSKLLITSDGAIQSTPTGGNARGTKATDLQIDRSGAAQVAGGNGSGILSGRNNQASGNYSVICGGENNQTSNVDAAVCGGTANVVSGQSAFIGGGGGNAASGNNSSVLSGLNNTASALASSVTAGQSNTASNQYAIVCGGFNSTASGLSSTVAGGNQNTASAENSTVPGGKHAVANLFGEISHGNIRFVTAGDSQVNELIWSIATTDATAGVEMFLDGTTATQRAVVGLNNTWSFDIYLVVRTSAGVSVVIQCRGGIQNVAGTVTLINTSTQAVLVDGSGGTITTANFVVSADNTNKSLKLAVTGIALTNIRWVAHARIVQVNF